MRPRQNSATIVAPIARPIGDGGVSTISSAAGRKASSSFSRVSRVTGKEMTFFAFFATPFAASMAALADFMDTTLHSVERRVAPAHTDEIIVSAVFDKTAMVERQDAVGEADRRQTVSDN